MQQFSTFEDCVESDEDDMSCKDQAIHFITGEYLSILESARYHVIYVRPMRPEPAASFAHHIYQIDAVTVIDPERLHNGMTDAGRTASKTVTWSEITHNSDMCGFDQIIALSQAAVNTHYHNIWKQAKASAGTSVAETLLAQWEFQQFFQGSFKPLTVRLRSDSRAIVSVNLQEGFLRPLRNRAPSAEYVWYCIVYMYANTDLLAAGRSSNLPIGKSPSKSSSRCATTLHWQVWALSGRALSRSLLPTWITARWKVLALSIFTSTSAVSQTAYCSSQVLIFSLP